MAAMLSLVVLGGPVSTKLDARGGALGGWDSEAGRFYSPDRYALPRGSTRAKVGGTKRRRRSGVIVQPFNSGTADENMIPDPAGGDFSIVDENMMVLRRRIEGLRMKESYIQTPDEWMDWEKSWYASYRADVNVLVGDLQSRLLSLRPSLVVFITSMFLAVTPVVALLLLSAIGAQLLCMNNAIVDILAPASTATPPP